MAQSYQDALQDIHSELLAHAQELVEQGDVVAARKLFAQADSVADELYRDVPLTPPPTPRETRPTWRPRKNLSAS